MPKYSLATLSLDELTEDTTAAAAADFLVRYDASAGKFVKVGADDLDANFGVTATATELNQAADISGKFVAAGATLSLQVDSQPPQCIYTQLLLLSSTRERLNFMFHGMFHAVFYCYGM